MADQLGDVSGAEAIVGGQESENAQESSGLFRAGAKGASGTNKELNVVAAYKAHFREDPLAWFQQVWAYGQGSGWRGCECGSVLT